MIRFVPIKKAGKKPPPKGKARTLDQAVLNAADATTPRATVTIMDSMKTFANGLTREQVEDLIRSGALDRDLLKLPWEQLERLLQAGVSEDLVRAVKAGADAANSFTTKAISAALGVEPVLTFDATNRRVENYIQRNTGKLIKNITSESRQAVKDVIQRSLSEPEFDMLDVFRAVKRAVPLDTRRANAVEAYRQSLTDGEMSQKQINAAVDRFADDQLKSRARTIARTEMMDAVNQGQLEGIKQAREEGWLKGTTVYKEWMVTPDDRLCPTCEEMDGIKCPIDGVFDVVLYSQDSKGRKKARGTIKVDKPPAHPNCRCCTNTIIE